MSAQPSVPFPAYHVESLRDALDHIARVAEQARTPTARLAFVVHRARCALEGTPYRRADVKLPPSGASETVRAQRRAIEQRERAEILAAALRRIAAGPACGCVPCVGQCSSPAALEAELEARRELAAEALAQAGAT